MSTAQRPTLPAVPSDDDLRTLEEELQDESKRFDQLTQQLDASQQRLAFLRRRVASLGMRRLIQRNNAAQDAAVALEASLEAFEASLAPPPDFNPAEDGEYRDTDEFADARVIDRAVDTQLVKAMTLLGEQRTFETGILILVCITHFVARCCQRVDDDADRLGDGAKEVMDDLREDVTESWHEVADLLHASSGLRDAWLQAVLGFLQDDCGNYFNEAVVQLSLAGEANYQSVAECN